jgi:hypothetical protein
MLFGTKENGEELMACLSRLNCRPRFYHRTMVGVTFVERMSQHGPWDTPKDENGLRKLSSCTGELVVVYL